MEKKMRIPHCFALIAVVTLAGLVRADDSLDYYDDFSVSNPVRWDEGEDAAAHCEHVCYEYDPELILYDQDLPGSNGENGMTLLLAQSDCASCCNEANYEAACNCISEDVCCCNRSGCSKFKGGHLRANDSRSFGRYESRFRTGGIGVDGGTVYTKTCFTPTYVGVPYHDEIALCFDADTPGLANFSRWAESTTGDDDRHYIQRNPVTYSDAFETYNHDTEYHTYTIDWHADRIEWYIDGVRMKVNDTDIPAEPGETVFIVRPDGSDLYTEDARMDVVYSSFMAFECESDDDCAGDGVCEYEDYQCVDSTTVPAADEGGRLAFVVVLLLAATVHRRRGAGGLAARGGGHSPARRHHPRHRHSSDIRLRR